MKLRTIPLLLGIFAPLGLSACNGGATNPSNGGGVIPVKKPIALIAGGLDSNYFGAVYSYNFNSESFAQVVESLGLCSIRSMTQTTDGDIYAGGCGEDYSGAVYSSNDATNWTQVVSQLGSNSIYSMVANGNIVYAGGESSDNDFGGVYTFESGVLVAGNLIESEVGFGAIDSMVISPTGTLYTGNYDSNFYGLVSSISANTAFTIESGIGYTGCPINALALDQSGNLYAAGCDADGTGAIYKYSGAVAPAESLATGLGRGAVNGLHSLAVADDGTVFAGGLDISNSGVVYKYANGQLSTVESGIGSNSGCPINSLVLDNEGTLYAGGCDTDGYGAIYSYTNSTESWSMIESRVGNPTSQGITSLILQY